MDVPLLDGHGLQEVQRLALRDAFDDVDEDDVSKLFGRNPVSGRRADVAGAYDGDFLAQDENVCLRTGLERARRAAGARKP